MQILSSRIEHARYCRDFGQVEAQVVFLVKQPGRPVPHELRLRTAEYRFGALPLRDRLIASARALLRARADRVQPAEWATAA